MTDFTHNHPCKGCVVLARCTEMCDKVSNMRGIDIKRALKRKECPDCGSHIRGKNRNKKILRNILLKNENWSCKTCKHDFKKFNNAYYRDIKLEFEGGPTGCYYTSNDSTSVTNYQVHCSVSSYNHSVINTVP